MNLSNINSNYPALNQFARQHIVQQGVKQQLHKTELYNRKLDALRTFITYQSQEIKHHPLKGAKDIAKLSSTCKYLRYNGEISNTNTVSQIAQERKNLFENDVSKFVNLFKDDNGNFKHRNAITSEINNGTIILHQDPLVLKEGFRVVFSNMSDAAIRQLLVGIKDNISEDTLVKLASIAIKKMSDDIPIRALLVVIKDNISSEDKLVKLASIAIEKMSINYLIRDLLTSIKSKISEDQLNNLKNQIKLKKTKSWCTIT